MSDNWEEQLRKKLENYEMEPPPGLWEDICKQMDNHFGLKPLSRLTGTAQRWWAVAAAVLALVGCFVVYEISDSEQPLLQADSEPQHQTQQQSSSEQPSPESVVAQHPSSQQQDEIVSPRSNSHFSHASSCGTQSVILTSDLSSLTSKEPKEPQAATEEMAHQQETPAEPEPQPVPVKPSEYEVLNDPVPSVVYEASGTQAKWSLGMKASGGLLAANNSVQTDRLYYVAAYSEKTGMFDYDDGTQHETSSYTLTEHVAKHQLPLRLGLSLQYQLNPRWALLSGISYTRLYSEFSIPLYHNISYNQKLHYIGIPFGVAWQLWQANRFSFYFIGGAMVEKCVSVDLSGDYQGKKPWQWSFNAAAGVEFAFTSLLGAYIEPSLGYYFSDGTQLEHYYKEHPLAPSIEFGLRMHLGR